MVDRDTQSKQFTITNLDEWETIPIKIISPMNCAVELEMKNLGIKTTMPVRIKPYTEYDFMPMCATPTDQPRPIIQAVCKNGFDGVGIGYIQRLATHLKVDHTGLSLRCLILDMTKKVIPVGEHCVQLWTSILDKKKRVTFEYDEDIEKVCELEYMLDTFDRDDRLSLEKEITKAKTCKTDQQNFNTEVCEWKVLSINGLVYKFNGKWSRFLPPIRNSYIDHGRGGWVEKHGCLFMGS